MSQPIEVIPVLDISGGIAVHARGGVRDRYAPVESVLSPGAPGDALAIARAYRRLGARRCYVADLDAIRGRPAQLDLLSRLRGSAGFNGPIMVDAGIATPEEASPVAADGHALVVGLENMRSLAALTALAWRWRVVFSIDLRDGENVLGRIREAVVCIPSTRVSRRHARIVVHGTSATVEDLGSKNGTYVGDRKIEGATSLVDGDTIRVGDAEFVFCVISSDVTDSDPLGRVRGASKTGH